MKLALFLTAFVTIFAIAPSPRAQTPASAPANAGACTISATISDPAAGLHWNGWSPTLANTRFQPAQQAGLTANDVPKLKLKWVFGIPNANRSRSQPTVSGGRLFVANESG